MQDIREAIKKALPIAVFGLIATVGFYFLIYALAVALLMIFE